LSCARAEILEIWFWLRIDRREIDSIVGAGVKEMNPKNLRYSENHEWVRDEGGVYVVGITEYAAEQLGDITYVELPGVGDEFAQDEEAATVESVKAASEVYCPIGGTVCEVNDVLENTPELINKDPYEDGWMFKLEGVDAAEFDLLMDASAYDKYLKEL
jgi:glycine cleavage system H protein